MSLLDIHVLGSPILRMETRIVTDFTSELKDLAENMFETMRAAEGIGLAAPQVGREERLAVIEVDREKYVIVNPEVIVEEGEDRQEEGCLSIPDIHGEIDRARRVVVDAFDLDGVQRRIEAEGLLARCLLHEIDHLHGKLFIDYLSLLKRRAALGTWETLKAKYPGSIRHLASVGGSQVSPSGSGDM
ncbi:MAG: Peptide deformylase [Gemmatimonadaceae bacterium]|nr:Peptide deformylase [Gemmatimonadaceae bacterium]